MILVSPLLLLGHRQTKEELRQKLDVEKSSTQMHNFFTASTILMQVMVRACGHDAFDKSNKEDLAAWHCEVVYLSGIKYSGFVGLFSNSKMLLKSSVRCVYK